MRNAMLAGTVLLAAVLAVGLGGCGKDEAAPPARPGGAAAETQPKFVNDRCPIMTDSVIDPDNVPPTLVREFRGKKVAFCCAGCPAAWDRLSDDEKASKLAAVTRAEE